MDIELREILDKVYTNEMKPDEAQWKICVLFNVSVNEVAVAFAEWCMEHIYEQENCKPTTELYEKWKKAKGTDR